MDTQVLIPNANTLVMGGLVDDNPAEHVHQGADSGRHPVSRERPSAAKTKLADKKNLLIFITPTILQDTDFHPTTTDFLNAATADAQGQS